MTLNTKLWLSRFCRTCRLNRIQWLTENRWKWWHSWQSSIPRLHWFVSELALELWNYALHNCESTKCQPFLFYFIQGAQVKCQSSFITQRLPFDFHCFSLHIIRHLKFLVMVLAFQLNTCATSNPACYAIPVSQSVS